MTAALVTANLAQPLDSLGKSVGQLGAAVIVLAAVAVISFCLLWLVSHHRVRLAQAIEPYGMRNIVTSGESSEDAGVVTMPAVRRVAVAFEQLAMRTRVGRWLAVMLVRSGLPVALGELLLVWILGGLILILIALLLAGAIGAAIVLVLAAFSPFVILHTMVNRRARKFDEQLPDILKLSASSLRAGFSFVQSLDAVQHQVKPPAQGELQQVLAEIRLGKTLNDALSDAAERIQNKDFSEAVMAVRIQQETGGNLASLLDLLADTMTQRVRMRREVRTLTAEGRVSAYVLGALPPLLGVYIFAVDRSYISELFNSGVGQAIFIAGVVLELVGFFWMFKVVRIEV